jgi:uncharacterized protein YkwD
VRLTKHAAYRAPFFVRCALAISLGATARSGSQGASEETSRATYEALERGIVTEINRLRTNPQSYAQLLERRRSCYYGTRLVLPGQGYEFTVITKEGWAAVEEAIQALRKTLPLPALKVSEGLSLAARDLARDQARQQQVSHTGSDGSTFIERISRYLQNVDSAGESITVGGVPLATEVVQKSLIDDGMKSRPHRRDLLSRDFALIGVACEPQAHYGFLCVTEFASQAGRSAAGR